MNKIFGLLSVLAVVAACGSETVDVSAPRTRPVPDTEGCYDVGQDPHTFACTPGCNYLEGSRAPFHGVTAGICVLACHANGQLVPACYPREDAGTDASDASIEDVPLDTTDVVISEDVVPVDVPHVRCMADSDCNDHDEMTQDTCDLSTGVCNHTRTVVEAPPFDPVARQMVRNLCEQPRVCSTGNAVELRSACGAGWETTWLEMGYLFDVAFSTIPSSGIIHVAPRLSAGDRRDSFRVRVVINSSMTPVINRVMTVAEIEGGVDVPVTTNGDILFVFQPAGESLYTTALQWDLPVGHVTDGEGHNLSTCLQAGSFTRIPQHGFLHLQEGTDGRLECAGRVLRTDPVGGVMVGWAREEASDALFYVYFPPAPFRTVYAFATAREAMGWINPPQSLQTLCATVLVLPNGTFSSLMGSSRREIGLRPGTYADWTDSTGGRHQGIASSNFTLLETPWPVGVASVCSLYGQFVNADIDHRCVIDATPLLPRYRIVSAPVGTGRDARAWYTLADLDGYSAP